MTRSSRLALALVPAAFGVVMVAWPLAAIFRRGLAPEGTLTLEPLGAVFASDRTRSLVRFTIGQAVASTLLTLVVGIPAAWALSRTWRGAGLARAIVTVPFVLPTVVVGLAFRHWLDRGTLAIVLAHAVFNVAVVVRVVGAAWAGLDPEVDEAARVLGATPSRAFLTTTLPRLRAAIAGAALVTFMFSFTSFGVITVLGGPRTGTIETEIARVARQLQFDRAAALTLVQLVVVAAVLALAARLGTVRGIDRFDPSPRRGRPVLLAAALTPALVLVVTPLTMLADRVARPHGSWSTAGIASLAADDTALAIRPLDSLFVSLRFALVATAVAGVVGGLAAIAVRDRRRGLGRLLEFLLVVPLGVSAVTIGYGYLVTFDEPPLELRAHWYIVPLAHAAVAVPFVVRATVPALRAVDPALREVAATLGARPLRVWFDVDRPLAARAFAAGVGFAAAISLGEFGATSLLAREGTPSAPFAIGRLLGRPGERNQQAAFALALVLGCVTALVVFVADALGRPRREVRA